MKRSLKHASNPEYRAVFYEVDVTSPDSVQNMIDFAIGEFGRIDYAINIAGVSHLASLSGYPYIAGLTSYRAPMAATPKQARL